MSLVRRFKDNNIDGMVQLGLGYYIAKDLSDPQVEYDGYVTDDEIGKEPHDTILRLARKTCTGSADKLK